MSIHERLRKARLAAGYSSTRAAAEAFGWSENTLRSNENGNKPYGRVAAEKYSRAFQVRLDWLLTGRGPMKGDRKGVLVAGIVANGAHIIPVDDTVDEMVFPPFSVDEDVIAFVMRGESMWPKYEDGDYVFAKPVADVGQVLKRHAVVTLDDGSRMLKRVMPGSRNGRYRLESHNAPPIDDVVIVQAARVIGTLEK